MTVTAGLTQPTRQHPARGRIGGAAGVAFVLLALAGNSLTGGGLETDAAPEAHAAEVARRTGDAAWRAGIAIELVAFVALLLFAAALARRIRTVEPADGYLGSLVLAGGVLFAAVKLASGSALYAADRRAAEIDPASAQLLTDLNDAAFALSFVPMAVLVGAAAVAALSYGVLPRWLGWLGAALAPLLVAAAASGADAVPVPFLLGLLWILASGAAVLRRPAPIAP